MSRARGIDVSFWNGKMDFHKAKLNGASFVIAKASQLYQDTRYAEYYPQIKAEGLLRGTYHYLDWRSSELSQLQLFLGVIKSDRGELPPSVDLEMDPAPYGLDKYEVQGRTWNTLVGMEKAVGVPPMLYVGYYYWLTWGSNDPGWAKYLNWLPWYAQEQYVKSPPPWNKWTFWQDDGKGNGTAWGSEGKEMDTDWYWGTVEQLKVFAGQPVTPAPPTPPPAPSPTFATYKVIYNIINVRSEPYSANNTFVRYAYKDEVLQVRLPEVRQAGYVWLNDGNWVWEEYITLVNTTPVIYPAYVPKSGYNPTIRSGPSTSYAQTGILMQGTTIYVDLSTLQNLYVKFMDSTGPIKTGWVWNAYLVKV